MIDYSLHDWLPWHGLSLFPLQIQYIVERFENSMCYYEKVLPVECVNSQLNDERKWEKSLLNICLVNVSWQETPWV